MLLLLLIRTVLVILVKQLSAMHVQHVWRESEPQYFNTGVSYMCSNQPISSSLCYYLPLEKRLYCITRQLTNVQVVNVSNLSRGLQLQFRATDHLVNKRMLSFLLTVYTLTSITTLISTYFVQQNLLYCTVRIINATYYS